jgi:trans-aconitate 2-methyltransferase
MLDAARGDYPHLQFMHGDIENLQLPEKADCLFANAALQWTAHHEKLFPALLQLINDGGMFAFQMPNNFHTPTHQTTIQILQEHPAWQKYAETLFYGQMHAPLYQATHYYDLLVTAGGSDLQIWETEYFQEMDSYQAIFDWVKSTGLRPVLSAMNEDERSAFRDVYVKKIADAFPIQKNLKILLPYRRIFMTGST